MDGRGGQRVGRVERGGREGKEARRERKGAGLAGQASLPCPSLARESVAPAVSSALASRCLHAFGGFAPRPPRPARSRAQAARRLRAGLARRCGRVLRFRGGGARVGCAGRSLATAPALMRRARIGVARWRDFPSAVDLR